MKKFSILLLCALMIITTLSACNQNTNSNENTTIIEGSDDLSIGEESSQASYPEIKVPEKVLYFTGNYVEQLDTDFDCVFGNEALNEDYSVKQGFVKYIQDNNPSDDTYFYIGAFYKAEDFDEFMKYKSDRLNHLKNNGFLAIENHQMLYDEPFWEEMWEAEGDYDKMFALREEYIKEKYGITQFDINEDSALHQLTFLHFYAVGYISVEDLRKLAENTEEEYYMYFVWLPSPDDQERWLTFEPKYRDE